MIQDGDILDPAGVSPEIGADCRNTIAYFVQLNGVSHKVLVPVPCSSCGSDVSAIHIKRRDSGVAGSPETIEILRKCCGLAVAPETCKLPVVAAWFEAVQIFHAEEDSAPPVEKQAVDDTAKPQPVRPINFREFL